ncbi:hypothetical protein AAG565_06000 [Fontimonas sp. SYSU GA230001]|uniref:hypothetical protein n=1 Tax=Fontimonas sp. SYSU GA230001 TaxID=3142450 RepID=UPI0032B52D5A
MTRKLLTATEAARRFSDVLDNVSHHGARYDIKRGRSVVARLVPARTAPRSISVKELSELLAQLPPLEPGDSARLERDIAAERKRLRAPRDRWR